ncbi:rhodanese-like domain-containing protein [Leptolyngbya iicbica]|nr:rhodanese-like domain-containing protein [Leptolyngbya sp. LK]
MKSCWLKPLLLITLVMGIWGIQNHFSGAIAAPTPPVCDATMAASDSCEHLIEQTLKEIPPGFYGILKTDQLKAKLKTENPLLVDVREPTEFLRGHLPNAVNIPLRSLGDHLDDIPRDRSVILYCSTGYRTGLGVMALHLWGYDNVQGYLPSYQGWLRDNQP